ncbi:MAG: sulfatase [Bacteroidales bacterium]|nr:sulfatase [Bacteroidales bacterium]
MKHPIFLVVISSVLLIFIGCREVPKYKNNPAKPNILLIVSEDQSPDLGCYGNTHVTTPHLDSLASQGVLFENAFVTYSVCSPSRSTIFTGLYPHQNGQIGLATHKYRMYQSFKTLSLYMREAGYRTMCLGKIHVNPESAIPFDEHPIKGANFARKNLPYYIAYADTFMRSTEKPFFIMVNFPDTHFPLLKQVDGIPSNPLDSTDVPGPLPWVGVNSPRLKNFTANYYNCVNRLDYYIGKLLDKLNASGKAENTLVIFLGDHGAQFSRGKCSNYEGGLKIPMIASFPGHMVEGQKRSELISTIDLLPTLLDAANIPTPDDLPGFSFLPIIKGDSVPEWREYLFADGSGSAAFFYFPKRSVRNNRYKLIHNLIPGMENPKYNYYVHQIGVHFAGGTNEDELGKAPDFVQKAYERWRTPPEFELYDLKYDPYEWYNLSDNPDYKDILEDLKIQLAFWQGETADPLADQVMLEKFTQEVNSVNQAYPDRSYNKDSAFQWKYPEYFWDYILNYSLHDK